MAGPSRVDTDAMRGGGGSGRGGDRIPSRREVGRADNTGVDENAGTSRFRRGAGSRNEDGGSTSESD